jgi:hypothetical protein
MAGDVIEQPPGQEPVATPEQAQAPAPVPEPEPIVARRLDRGERARKSSYRFRFGAIYVALAAVVGAGIGAAVILALRPAPPEAAAWSSWEPDGSKLARVRQIADHIPRAYKGENGQQLTVTEANQLAVPTETGSVPISSIFVRPDASKGQAEEDDVSRYDGSSTVSYGLCGLGSGSQCAITAGKPSADRFTLLRRQALELSLYTFKYVDGVDSVIVFMPPSPKGQSNGTVFLRKDDVKDELRRPIAELLPAVTPRIGELSQIELGNILRLTQPRTYAFQFQAAPDGRPVLVLSPPAAGS